MNAHASPTAPSASAQTPPFCLRQVSSPRIAVPTRFIVAPLAPSPVRCCQLSPPSAPTAALLPLTVLD